MKYASELNSDIAKRFTDLFDMHKRKIDMADMIYVINVGGYVGPSTRSEIEYASATGKSILYLEEPEGTSK